MTIWDYLPLLAGIGLFLYGMSVMGSSLEKLAGSRMESTLEKLTTNRFSGVLLGTAVTALIQSSAATTVMVVGFVNAGIMKLTQAVSVIMGANIGTTVTAQIIRLSEASSGGNAALMLLKPSTFAPILILIGAALILFSPKKRVKEVGLLVFGFGTLFFGMNVMERTLSPLRESPELAAALTRFENPFLGVLLGAGVTVALQSSSASVGLLQALSTTGAVSFAVMVPIVFGQNIGTCVTVLLASIGANKNAQRAAMIHLYFNIIGTVLFFVAIYGAHLLGWLPFFDNPVGMGDIANFHTLFNIVSVAALLPFCGMLVKLANATIRSRKSGDEVENSLDERFLATPSIAVEQSRAMILKMGRLAAENVNTGRMLLSTYDPHARAALEEKESFCDKAESMLTEYLVKVVSRPLSDRDGRLASEMFRTLSDFERISDRAVNIADVAEYNNANGISFTETGKKELGLLAEAIDEILKHTLEAYENLDESIASHIEPLEEVIDVITESLKNRHVDRLQNGLCSITAGISFLELLTNYERIADHCSNIAIYVIQFCLNDANFDRHEHVRRMHEGLTGDFKAFYAYYENQYYRPLQDL